MNMTQYRLYWVCICLLAFPIGCSKSHQASTSVDAGVDAGDSQTDASGKGELDSQAGGSSGTRTNGDEGSGGSGSDEETKEGGTGSNGGISGTDFSSGNGGVGQGSGGSDEDIHYDRDGFEPYDESTILPIPRPVCPETPPTEGTACTDAGTSISGIPVNHQCGYGTSLRADCREVYYCTSDGTWGLYDPTYRYACEAPPQDACPETPTPGESCETVLSATVLEVVCEFEGFTICTCSRVQTLMSGSLSASWRCFEPPGDSRCPPIMPNFGEGCDVQALECVYNDPCFDSGDAVFCRRGEWIGSFVICAE